MTHAGEAAARRPGNGGGRARGPARAGHAVHAPPEGRGSPAPLATRLATRRALCLALSCALFWALLALGGCRHGPATDGSPQLPAAPQRIVPASAAAVDLVSALVGPDRVAGLPAQALDYSGIAALGEKGEAFLRLPQFHTYAAEPLLALSPDLVLADTWQLAETTARLREAGVPVIALTSLESLEDVRRSFTQLGDVLGVPERARAALAELDARVAALQDGAQRRSGRTVLAYSNGGAGGWIAGAGTAADAWIRLAGLENAAAERVGHQRCSFEELLLMDPDLLVVSGPGAFDRKGATERLLRTAPALAGLRALAGERIVVLPAWLYDTVSQHIVTAAEELARGADRALGGP
jgi:iron complex transport system substrate-binding protein